MIVKFIDLVHERNNLSFILGTISNDLNVDLKDLFSRSTRKTGGDAKILFYFFAVRICGHTSTATAKAAGRDHSSVLQGIDRALSLIETDPQFYAKHLKILNSLENGLKFYRRTNR